MMMATTDGRNMSWRRG